MSLVSTASASVLVVSCAIGLAQQTPPATVISDSLLSKEAKEYQSFNTGMPAEEIISKHKGFDSVHNVYVVAKHPQEEPAPGHAPSIDPLRNLKAQVYNSDLIIIGVPTRRVSALTESHEFVFSDYETTVESLLLDKTKQYGSGSQLVITRPGGEVTINGNAFRAIEPEFPLFHLGERYIFLLHFNPSLGSYSVNASDVYKIEGNRVVAGRIHSTILSEQVGTDAFIDNIRIALLSDTRRTK